MGIEDLQDIHRVYIPLSEQDRSAFVPRRGGVIPNPITADNFRVDLDQARDSEFNMQAILVFARDLHRKIKDEHWYSLTYDGPQPLDPLLVSTGYLEYTFFHHLKHVKEVYRQSTILQPAKRAARSKAAARSQRKQTVSGGIRF